MTENTNSSDYLKRIVLGPEMLSAVIAWRCREDEAFRDHFEENPKACIQELCGQQLPEELEIMVSENSDEVWNIPLPSAESLEAPGKTLLSEEELKKVSGGLVLFGAVVSATTAFAALSIVTIAIGGTVGLVALGGGLTAAILLGD